MNTRSVVLKIVKADYVGDHSIKLLFSDAKEQIVDFGPFLKCSMHPEIQKYSDSDKFKKFSVRDGELMWGDFDLIFPIMDLYKNRLTTVT